MEVELTTVNRGYRVTHKVLAKVVADATGKCSPHLVKKVRMGIRNGDSKLGKKIVLADNMIQEGIGKLFDNVNNAIK